MSNVQQKPWKQTGPKQFTEYIKKRSIKIRLNTRQNKVRWAMRGVQGTKTSHPQMQSDISSITPLSSSSASCMTRTGYYVTRRTDVTRESTRRQSDVTTGRGIQWRIADEMTSDGRLWWVLFTLSHHRVNTEKFCWKFWSFWMQVCIFLSNHIQLYSFMLISVKK